MDESVQKHLEQEQQALKLSAAIRIGALMRPQCREGFFRDGGSCAMGAALEATGWRHGQTNITVREFYKRWPEVGDCMIYMRIYAMNDEGKTREEIADWLESQGY